MSDLLEHKKFLSLMYNHRSYKGYDELHDLSEKLVQSANKWESDLGCFLGQWIDDSPLIELHTSGSTGERKTIMMPKKAMIASARRTLKFFDLKPNDKALLCLSTGYIAGKMMVVRAILGGLDLISVEVSANPLDTLDERVDFAAMVPAQALTVYNESKHRFDLVKTIILGGAKVDNDLAFKLSEVSTGFWETYGMTETVSHIALRKVKPGKNNAFELMEGLSIHVDDRSCLVVDPSDINQLSLNTNDVIELIDNRHFVLKGRYDNVINSGGIKLYPEEIEARLAIYIQQPFIIISIPHEKWGEAVVLVVESDEEWQPETRLFNGMDKYEIPKAVFCLPLFPRTDSGKIKRNEIKEKLLTGNIYQIKD